jgi:7-cyano-7-deazaguanine synthase
MKVGVVLLSGGLDSTTTSAFAKSQGYKIFALTFFYGQRLHKEIQSATKVAENLGIEHKIMDISSYSELAWYSALTNPDLFSVPENRTIKEMTETIPITYVPMRNTFLIVMAAAYLESQVLHLIEKQNVKPEDIEASIFIAANALDYSGYPDCRQEFYEEINKVIRLASKAGTQYNVNIKVETPLLFKNKKEIVELGMTLEAPLEWTWSCYAGGETPCGKCDSCLLRAKGFQEAGYDDPLLTRLESEKSA